MMNATAASNSPTFLMSIATKPKYQMARPLLALFAGVLLLFMQALLLEHQTDLAHHQADEPCELCLHLAPLDHSLVNALAVPQRPIPALAPASQAIVAALPPHHTAYHPRGPPRLS
jgi:hypothetical protein